MEIVFGAACDGQSFPDFPGTAGGIVNSMVLGPSGLLDILEIQLGLTGPVGAAAVRVAAYAARLRASLAEAPDAFFASSFSQDPWATAKMLLEWRDQLVLGGWQGGATGAARPDMLARVEALKGALPRGRADRLRSVLTALEARPVLSISRISLVEPLEHLPPGSRRLVEAVAACGVTMDVREPCAQTASGDLATVQAFLTTGAQTAPTGDGSFVMVQADTALMAAETVADWLASGSEADLAGTVVLSPDGDTALLDLALQARGLPALGQSASSPWRGALQVLPLAFASSWAPFNAKALLDLLLLPRPPIGQYAARRLAGALSREPGNGGEAWKDAWTAIEAELTKRFADQADGADQARRRLVRWREWTTGGHYSRAEGMPASAARQIAARVISWVIEADRGAHDPLLLTVAAAASALAEAIDVLGLEQLPALLVERMIEQVLAEGAQNPLHLATAGGLRCSVHPAAIWGPVKRLIWWDFKGPGERIPTSPWSRAERDALAASGCELEPAAEASARVGRGYANAILRTVERVMLVRQSLSGGEETTSHPLAHQLHPVVSQAAGLVTWKAEQLLAADKQRLAGRSLARQQVKALLLPEQTAVWTLPQNAIDRLEGRRESATSFERLADCQLRWLLQDVLRLSEGRFAEIPGPSQLLGNLAHEIANMVLPPGPAPDPEQVRAETIAAFDGMLAAIASPLQQPEFAGELATARVQVPAALAELARLLKEKQLSIVGTELERGAVFADGLSVIGRIDLIVEHETEGLGVIDLKWTRSARRRRTELADGRALQLATYGAIAGPPGNAPVPGAYYLLGQRRLIGPVGALVAQEEVTAERSLDQTWSDLVDSWRTWRNLAREGIAVATGLKGADARMPEPLPIPPTKEPCSYCTLTRLCRVSAKAA